MTTKRSRATSRRRTWTWPIVIGVVSLAGLVLALVGDGAYDIASWIALGLPVVACLRFGIAWRPRRD